MVCSKESPVRFSAFAETHAEELEELEINPLLVLPEGVAAVDVLLRLRAG